MTDAKLVGNNRLTRRQISRIETLPEGHRLVSARLGEPVVRARDGRLFRVKTDGRLAPSIRIERVQSYLQLGG